MAEYGRDELRHRLDQLSTEALNELLRSDIDSDAKFDEEYINCILSVLESRDNTPEEEKQAEVEQAWKTFNNFYNIDEGKGKSLYPIAVLNEEPSLQAARKKTHTLRKTFRRAFVAALIAICTLTMFVPYALGYEGFFQMIGSWTNSIFSFVPGTPSSSAPNPGSNATTLPSDSTETYQDIQEAVTVLGIEEAVVPTWLPSGFDQKEVTVNRYTNSSQIEIYAFYKNGEKSISISINKATQSERIYEKDDVEVLIYPVDGISHYIFENNNRLSATWYVSSVECSIHGDITIDEMKKIINSIYER